MFDRRQSPRALVFGSVSSLSVYGFDGLRQILQVILAGWIGLGAVELARGQAPNASRAKAGAGPIAPEMPSFEQLPPEIQQRVLQQFDKNGNGKLDDDERQAAIKAAQQRRGGAAPGTGTGGKVSSRGAISKSRAGGSNSALPSLDNLPPEAKQRLLERFDKNGNGKLDAEELAAARAALKDRQAASGTTKK